MKLRLLDTLRMPFFLVAIFWAVELTETTFDLDFTVLGVLPRSVQGILGIFLMPFLHGSFGHLFSNTPSFVILCGSVIYFYPRIANKVLIYSYLLTGFGVWLFARSTTYVYDKMHVAHHIGASGLIYAYAGFLFFSGVFRRETKSLSISLAVAVLYYGMWQGIIPNDPRVSWEAHLIGALIGTGLAYAYRKEAQSIDKLDLTEKVVLDTNEGYQNIENEYVKYTYKEKE